MPVIKRQYPQQVNVLGHIVTVSPDRKGDLWVRVYSEKGGHRRKGHKVRRGKREPIIQTTEGRPNRAQQLIATKRACEAFLTAYAMLTKKNIEFTLGTKDGAAVNVLSPLHGGYERTDTYSEVQLSHLQLGDGAA